MLGLKETNIFYQTKKETNTVPLMTFKNCFKIQALATGLSPSHEGIKNDMIYHLNHIVDTILERNKSRGFYI